MSLTRRNLMKLMAAGAVTLRRGGAFALPGRPEIPSGKFEGTRESLKAWTCPEWYRDAKFGLFAHWGPQSAAEFGDWYARRLYQEGSAEYKHHCETYGHPSKVGYKDVIPTWRGDRWDPEHLLDMYTKAGAKYFVSMGVHHDNFDLWDSKHTRWNSVNMGPKKDIVRLFAEAARKRGLRFGVTDHLAVSYNWFQTSHGADKVGPLAGLPYDGNDTANWDLYHKTHKVPLNDNGIDENLWSPENVPEAWKMQYFLRIKDLIDHCEPDLIFVDGPIFFEEYGLSLVAHLYNVSAKRHGGNVEAVYISKGRDDGAVGTCVLDLERGVADKIWPKPWQTDTCVGQWHYNRGQKYKDSKMVIDMLVDVVSRNGNLLLNFPLPNSGALDDEELQILGEITDWMAVNSEGIYATRPWKVFGGGPETETATQAVQGGHAGEHAWLPKVAFNETIRKPLTAEDVRYMQKGSLLYAFAMGAPKEGVIFPHLGTLSQQRPGKIQHVQLLGFDGKVKWKQEESGLKIQMPRQAPCWQAVGFKIVGA